MATGCGERGTSENGVLAPPSCGVGKLRLVGRHCACRSRSRPARLASAPILGHLLATPEADGLGEATPLLRGLVGVQIGVIALQKAAPGGHELRFRALAGKP